MKTIKRALAVLLALFIALGAFGPLIAARALTSAALGNGTYGTQVSGTPDSLVYDEEGVYLFQVVLDGSDLKLRLQKPGDTEYALVATISDPSAIVYGNLTFTTTDGSDWANGDSFQIKIVEGGGSGSPFIVYSRAVKYNSSGDNTDRTKGRLSVITRSTTVNLFFTVVDPAVSHGAVVDDSARVVFEQGAFTAVQSSDVSSLDSYASQFLASSAENAQAGKATFDISLTRLRYTGSGNTVSFTVFYYTADGEEHSLPLTATISECKESVDSSSDDDEEEDPLAPLTPYIIVSSYNYGGSGVTAGENFTLRMALTNTSDTYALENIIMNVSPSGVFSLVNSSNTVYIPTLMAAESLENVITIHTGLTALTTDTANAINISFKYQYVANETRLSGDASESITIPVVFPDRFETTQPELPGMVYAGEQFSIYVPFVNKGRNAIYNLSAELTDLPSGAAQKAYIGNLDAGSEDGVDFMITADMEGTLTGRVVFTYEDANMNRRESVLPFSVEVMGYDFPGSSEEPFPMPEPELPTNADAPGKNIKQLVILCAGRCV